MPRDFVDILFNDILCFYSSFAFHLGTGVRKLAERVDHKNAATAAMADHGVVRAKNFRFPISRELSFSVARSEFPSIVVTL